VIEATTLTDGGQAASAIGARLTEFITAARESLDIAVYDLALSPRVAEPVIRAIREAAARGVRVRLVHNVDHERPIPVPPPPERNQTVMDTLGVPVRAIPGIPDLMHHKYVVRDGSSVWTGSTNWTDDAWTREENVIVTVASPIIASGFARNFDELWTTEQVRGTGEFTPESDTTERAHVRPWFSPGRGRRISHRIAGALGRATKRIRIASPVITSGPVLGTLSEVATAGRVDLAAVVDATQMQEVHDQWLADGKVEWKIDAFASTIRHAPVAGKLSTPWGQGTVHDYMHAKVTVADDVVFVGSYNLSHSGEDNAENVLEIKDPELADRMAAFVDTVRGRYPALVWPRPSPARAGR
jgi:phosphatidylserine/phosphatidylglycerophosphate/cardiolipin synthase-like enzyme